MKFWKTTGGRPWRVLGALGVAVALLGSLGTTAASAATGPGAASAVPASSTNFFAQSGRTSMLGVQSLSPAFSACGISRFGYGGQYICGTGILDVAAGTVANNGGAESFVIGTNWQIWHAWPGSNGWHSLGGVAEHTTGNGIAVRLAFPFIIQTFGTDGGLWCDNWATPTWGGWYSC